MLRNRCATMKERNPHMIREFTQKKPANICMRNLQNTRVASDARVSHKESRAYTKNEFLRYFWAFSYFGVFWKVLANWNTFPTAQKWGQTELQNSRYGSSKIGVFSVTSMKCRHATKSWTIFELKWRWEITTIFFSVVMPLHMTCLILKSPTCLFCAHPVEIL